MTDCSRLSQGGNRRILLWLAFMIVIMAGPYGAIFRYVDHPYIDAVCMGDTSWSSTTASTYLQQTKDDDATDVVPTRRLEFVHIPKTGGTVIDTVAARNNITWSICHFWIKGILNETRCPRDTLQYPWLHEERHHYCPWWHLPPQYFELHKVNPYAGADLFCVVRNPYDRLISEYFFEGTYITNQTMENLNNVAQLNAWVDSNMRFLIMNMKRGDMGRNRTGNQPYFRSAGHFIPQYDYVFEHRRRIIKHVLHFENMVDEFHALMKLYNLPLRLPKRRLRPSHSKTISANNLTRKNMELIERLYQDDFREWGYEILSESLPSETLPPTASRASTVSSASKASNASKAK